MDFGYTPEQLALRETLQRFVAREYRFEQRQALLACELGFSAAAWRTYAELGLLALPFPESLGGLNGSATDVMLAMEQIGRGLLLEPYLPTVVLAGGLLVDFANRAQAAPLIESLIAGELKLALAHGEPRARYQLAHVATTAEQQGAGWRLRGHKAVVLGGPSADRLIVSARTNGEVRDCHGISLFLVDARAEGVKLRAYATHDGTRAADIQLDQVQVGADALVGLPDQALPAIERAVDLAIAALCAEAAGIIQALNESTLEYLKTRKQFGVPIGGFQALQHRMADMAVAAEQAQSMAILAAVRVNSADAALRRRAVSGAKAYIGQAARFVGQQAVQLHGGMGVTDALIVSHYFKRLTAIGLTFGDADYHLTRFGDLACAEPA